MTKARSQYIYKFTGTILGRQFRQAPSTSKYAGREYLQLKVVLENQPGHSLQVFREKLINTELWDLLHSQPKELFRKKYLFHCRNIRGRYHLVDWEELPEASPKEEGQ